MGGLIWEDLYSEENLNKYPKQPTVPLMPNMDDCLVISFDKHKGKRTWLTIMRNTMGQSTIVNMFKDEEAEELYKKLVDWDKS